MSSIYFAQHRGYIFLLAGIVLVTVAVSAAINGVREKYLDALNANVLKSSVGPVFTQQFQSKTGVTGVEGVNKLSINELTVSNEMLVAGKQTIQNGDNSVTHYGPNAAWQGRLAVGASQNRTEPKTAQVISTDGNLHLDPSDGRHVHLNYYKGGNVYVGRSDRPSNLNVYGNTNVGGKLFFKDERMAHWPDGPNNSDPYFLEKVIGGGNQSSLRLTINDDDDESFQIWGGSCAAGNCGGTGAMKHAFFANGETRHTGNMVVGRHIDAQHSWGNGKTLFAGWGGDKVVLGNHRTGKHDAAFHAPPNTVVSTNNMLVAGNQSISDGDNSKTIYGPNATWGGKLVVGASGDQGAGHAQVIVSNGNLHLDTSGEDRDLYLNYFRGARVRVGRGDKRCDMNVHGNLVVGRHIDAMDDWNGKKTLFAGWGGDKVVLGNHKTGKHDVANNAPANTVVSANDMLVAGGLTVHGPALVAGDVKADANAKLCIGDVCIDKAQLSAIKAKSA